MKELQQCKEGESLLRNLFKASLAQFDARLTKTEFIVAATILVAPSSEKSQLWGCCCRRMRV
jgi:hypothetical protein